MGNSASTQKSYAEKCRNILCNAVGPCAWNISAAAEAWNTRAGEIRQIPSEETIGEFANASGYIEVWRSWRDNMLAQGRTVPDIRMSKETLPKNDIELDRAIAHDVIADFCAWYWSHHIDNDF